MGGEGGEKEQEQKRRGGRFMNMDEELKREMGLILPCAMGSLVGA